MFREYLTRNTCTKVTNWQHLQDDDLPVDGYTVCVNNKGDGIVRHNGSRGLKYALQTVASITNEQGKTLVCYVADHPSFALRGIIEGYYGKPYTWDERRDAIAFAANHKMNAYFYAPKDDRYHRDLWRTPYPNDQLECIKNLLCCANEQDVMFYYCLSPGKDFRYTCSEDYDVLLNKYLQVARLGVDRFALLFDDISQQLTEEEKRQFSSAAQAHCHVANWLNKRLRKQGKLIVCPTDYYQNTDTPYRQDMRANLDQDIDVIWTGHFVVAEAIPQEDCIEAVANFGRKLVLWDNYPVNDYEPKGRIYVDAICNRTTKIAQYHVGAISNTSELWQSSKFMLCSFAKWMWNAENYNSETAYRQTLDELVGDDPLVRFFVGLNRTSPLRVYPTNTALFAAENWAQLDEYHRLLKRATLRTRKTVCPALAAEWKGLFEYALLTCKLYWAMRKGEPLQPIASRLASCRYHLADQSLVEYVSKKGLAQINPIAEKTVFWQLDRTAD